MDFGVAIPFVEHLGFELTVFADGRSELMYDPRPEHLNSFAVTHGGALMTLLDVTMAVAARSVQKDMGVVTIEMKTSFMQAARGPLTARGHLMHRTAMRHAVRVQMLVLGCIGDLRNAALEYREHKTQVLDKRDCNAKVGRG
jgi:uncharacterized protein (TIGR00369 family)